MFGHLCEEVSFPGSSFLYLLIYSFHMPAFVFISGYCCSKSDGKRLVVRYLYPYVVFQTLYIALSKYGAHQDVVFQYTTPYWILWYLLALFAWNAMLLLMGDFRRTGKYVIILTGVVSLLIGYADSVSYFLSLSRILALSPFFFAGYYIKNMKPWLLGNRAQGFGAFLGSISLLGVFLVILVLYRNQQHLLPSWAFFARPYRALNYAAFHRLFFDVTATTIILFLCLFVPNKRIPIITTLGQSTMEIFLLHGFLVRFVNYKNIVEASSAPLVCVILITLIVVGVCSVKPVKKLVRPLIVWPLKK